MKNILYVQHTLSYSPGNPEFIDFIFGLTNCRVQAVFFEHVAAAAGMSASGMPHWDNVKTEQTVSLRRVGEDNIRRFKAACHARDIPFSVSRMSIKQAAEIVLQSRYADLLLLDVGSQDEALPHDVTKELLCLVECPVVIIPLNFEGIEELVFTYDGKRSSIYAIKQFSYLFPHLFNYKTVVTCINPGEIDGAEWKMFHEWVSAWYHRVEFSYAEGDVEEELVSVIRKRDHPFIVMGAYGRGIVSHFYHHSHADPVIQLTSQAIFMAHH